MHFDSFLKDFIKTQSLTNTRLAEQLEVPAATISHLLSGRNKPSLDFIRRLIRNFPTLDLYEIMELNEYNYSNNSKITDDTSSKVEKSDLFSMSQQENKKVKKIVLLYEDNTFEEYN